MGAFFACAIVAILLFWFAMMVDFCWQHRGNKGFWELLGAVIRDVKGTTSGQED